VGSSEKNAARRTKVKSESDTNGYMRDWRRRCQLGDAREIEACDFVSREGDLNES
jgi:hypothetical protein